MKVSSSMIRTSVAISAASSRPDSSTSSRSAGTSMSRMVGRVLLGETLERDQQEGLPRQRRDLAEPLLDRHLGVGTGSASPLTSTEFQIFVNSR